jgi:hypothetical protein
MTYRRFNNNINYIYIHENNELKNKSLEDNVYFTLRDIFNNGNSTDIILQANDFNSQLVDNIYYEERSDQFQYTNILYDKEYLLKLIKFLQPFNEHWFEFTEFEEEEEEDMKNYIKFDEWFEQFKDLKILLEERYNNTK